jgi:hypothetical protein
MIIVKCRTFDALFHIRPDPDLPVGLILCRRFAPRYFWLGRCQVLRRILVSRPHKSANIAEALEEMTESQQRDSL